MVTALSVRDLALRAMVAPAAQGPLPVASDLAAAGKFPMGKVNISEWKDHFFSRTKIEMVFLARTKKTTDKKPRSKGCSDRERAIVRYADEEG